MSKSRLNRRSSSRWPDAILRQTADRYLKAGAPIIAARCFAQLGEREQALRLIEACAARRCSSLVNVLVEPDFNDLRAEPRFQAAVAMVQRGGDRSPSGSHRSIANRSER